MGDSTVAAAKTDLEKYVSADGRDKMIQDVRKKIEQLGITYIYYQFISVTGRIVVRVYLLITGSEPQKRGSSWFTVRQRTCLPIVPVNTLVMDRKHRSLSAYLTPILFVSCRGTKELQGFIVFASATVKKKKTREVT